MVITGRTEWVEHVGHIEEMRNVYKYLIGNNEWEVNIQ